MPVRKSLYYVNCMLVYGAVLADTFLCWTSILETLKWVPCCLVIQGCWSLSWMSITDLKADSMCQYYSHKWTESHCFELSIRSFSRIAENGYGSLSMSCATSCHFPFTSHLFVLADGIDQSYFQLLYKMYVSNKLKWRNGAKQTLTFILWSCCWEI